MMKQLIILTAGTFLAVSTIFAGKAKTDGRLLLYPDIKSDVKKIKEGPKPEDSNSVRICYSSNAGFHEQLAARELRRYLYLRTGKLHEIETVSSIPAKGDLIVIADKGSDLLKGIVFDAAAKLKSQEYSIKTIDHNERKILFISGGDPLGTLYGAYHFAELLGVRFYLHGDVIPDEKIQFSLPDLDETGKPLFNLRGILPYHDFPEGPDWWQHDDYKAIISQLPKLRMNFIGLHTYFGEPAVWIGMEKDVDLQGNVKFSYPATYSNTTGSGWGYAPLKTSAFTGGSSLLFDKDAHGVDYLHDHFPFPDTDDEMNEVFNSTGQMFKNVFTQARQLGIKTCVGTELSVQFPPIGRVRQRLKESGIDPASTEATREIYKGIFRRIQRTYPLDYYWLWTQEGWVVNQFPKPVDAVVNDLKIAIEAWNEVKPEFNLATCGWTLGPPDDVTRFDRIMPEGAALSSINLHLGFMPLVTDFAQIKNRPTWAIPWLEDDCAMISPQLWAGRMRRDAADAHAYGCDGLIGIHWRTRELGPQIAALAKAGWSQKEWNTGFGKPVIIPKVKSKDAHIGGKTAAFPDIPIADTQDDSVYQHVRYNLNAYRIEVPNGTYNVTLQFCELQFNQAGKRVFDVKVQGKQVVENLDIFSRAGKNRALDVSFSDVKIEDNRLSIEFARQVQFPTIAGIVIEGKTEDFNQIEGVAFSRRINCGGQAHGHYESDLPAIGDVADLTKPRDLPVDDFYADWVKSQFGSNAAGELTALFIKLDGGPQARNRDDRRANLPRPSDWNGPGAIVINTQPWEQVSKQYAHVDEMAALRGRIRGKGNIDRFDYWLNTFRYNRYLGQLGCLRGQLDSIVHSIKAEQDASIRKKLVKEEALPVRIQLSRLWEQMMTCQLQRVSNVGEMGTIANLEQHNRLYLHFLDRHDRYLQTILGQLLPFDIQLTLDYNGPGRLIVPTVRTQINRSEQLTIPAVILDKGKTVAANLYWRPLNEEQYQTVPLTHVKRGVYNVTLPSMESDFEYYIQAESSQGQKLLFPATAPDINQTVIVITE